jgi:VanZ family protein
MVRRFSGLVRWVPALLWMGFIYYWSSRSTTPSTSVVVSKLAHVTEYAALSWLVAFGLGLAGRWALVAWLWAAAYGAGDEAHQMFTPLRHPQVQDVMLDSAAAALALQGLRYLVARRRLKDGAIRLPGPEPGWPRARTMPAPDRGCGESRGDV